MRPPAPRLTYSLIAIVAVLALALGAGRAYATRGDQVHLSATDRVKAHTPPPLFTDQQVAPLASAVADQQAKADAAMGPWWDAHGSTVDDRAFVAWVESQVPAPPSTMARTGELGQVETLGASRTRAGVNAATWLEVYGKKDVWKLYQHDQRELEPHAVGAADKKAIKLVLSMSKTVADASAAKFRQSAPYVLDPALRPDHTVAADAVCPCSYPSRHAARAAAARTYLGHVAPRRLADYTWMESQVDFSRIYMAGHVESDITAGSMVGDMIADYVLVSRGKMPRPPV